jgi:hypothetical protein
LNLPYTRIAKMNELSHNGFSWFAGYLDARGRIAIGRNNRDSPARLDVVSIDRGFCGSFNQSREARSSEGQVTIAGGGNRCIGGNCVEGP